MGPDKVLRTPVTRHHKTDKNDREDNTMKNIWNAICKKGTTLILTLSLLAAVFAGSGSTAFAQSTSGAQHTTDTQEDNITDGDEAVEWLQHLLGLDAKESPDRAKEIIKEKGVTYKNVAPSDKLIEQVPVNAVPVTYFVDSEGRVLTEPVTGADFEMYSEKLAEALEKIEK